ncbi:alpha/beta hydrolase [Tenacibaculum amylolyticum]|uniref:alpha/beta hydrolase n=1 Tax=Tenacibaculum amylolyticum TaxID=104269 RepID=UPI0038957461
MRKTAILILWILLSVFTKTHSQATITQNIIGENHTLHSNILEEDRLITIYVPEDYQNTTMVYPVLYILDGQRYFLNGVLYQNTLGWQEKTPNFIVVGIHTNNRTRRKLFFEKAPSFIQFLSQELIPYIEKNYRTSSKRMFFGWEMAGGLAIELLAQPKSIFSAYFISSPTHINDTRLHILKQKLNTKSLNEFLYITLSPSETWAQKSVDNLVNILEEQISQKANWHYTSLTDENHHSTPTPTIHKGLNTYYKDYPYLRFKTLKEFEDFGGIDALKTHYKKRGQKYSVASDIHKSTKHFLLLQAMKEDNFNTFDFFMNSFGDYYKSKTRDLWFNRYAQFYIKHNNPNKAIEILNVGLIKFPSSLVILSSLGDAFLKTKNKIKAKEYYTKAVALAIKNKDKNLERYKSKLKQI